MVFLCKGFSNDTKDTALIRIIPEDTQKPAQNNVVLRIRLHCEGCSKKIKKKICRIKGVDDVKIEFAKDQVTVKGRMDVKEIVPYLKRKLKRNVEVVPASNIKEYEKKDNKGTAGFTVDAKISGSNKDKEATAAAGGDVGKEQVTKREFHGYPDPPLAAYWCNGHGYGQSYPVENHRAVHGNRGHQHSGDTSVTQMFSDENPNACTVM